MNRVLYIFFVAYLFLYYSILFSKETMVKPKIAIVHYRVGRTDGVSLEIDKRKYILEQMGYEVKLISGGVQNGADHIIEELEFERPEIVEIRERSFAYFKREHVSEVEIMQTIFFIAQAIEKKFLKYHAKEQFDAMLIHNVFSLALHLPASLAFTNIINKLKIPVVATHHDFYWERERFQIPINDFIKEFLEKYVPPKHENITHVCINTLAQKRLKKRTGINAKVLPDVFDFEQEQWAKDAYNKDFLERIGVKQNDLIVLQATRIVERKGIELAIHFVKELEKHKYKLIGKILYNGKTITKDSDVVLVLAGYPERFALPYLEKLKKEIKRTGIKVKFVYDMIDVERSLVDGNKIYSLWDAYVFADIVTYPSLWEGWGNQFIEAVFAKKPIVVFEYPVFKVDIKSEGYFVISLGEKITDRDEYGLVKIDTKKMKEVGENTVAFLLSQEILQKLNKNFFIGKSNHGYAILRWFLENNICL